MADGRLRICWIVSGRLYSAATASDVNEIVITNSSIQWTNHRLRNWVSRIDHDLRPFRPHVTSNRFLQQHEYITINRQWAK
eukprot:scaffold92021_cov71-Cyclotella_meneghiniana.AAC.3